MTDKMREEFEAAFARKTASLGVDGPDVADLEQFGGFEQVLLEAMTEDRTADTYRNNVFASAWWAWNASRESLVIDLSDLSNCFSPNDCGDWAMWLDDVRILVQRAGMGVSKESSNG